MLTGGGVVTVTDVNGHGEIHRTGQNTGRLVMKYGLIVDRGFTGRTVTEVKRFDLTVTFTDSTGVPGKNLGHATDVTIDGSLILLRTSGFGDSAHLQVTTPTRLQSSPVCWTMFRAGDVRVVMTGSVLGDITLPVSC
jgi:hypothetical protein